MAKLVKIKEEEFELEDKDAALVLAMQELSQQLGRNVNNG